MLSFLSNSADMHFGYLKLKGYATTIRTAVVLDVGVVENQADETIQIPSRDKKRTITVDVYRPPSSRIAHSTPSSSRSGSPRTLIPRLGSSPMSSRSSSSGSPPPIDHAAGPYLVNFHASYSVLDALRRTDVHFLQKMANETNHTVYDVHYRLAPEHPFPAAFEDGEDVIKALPAGADISISGFASGGNLALALSSTSEVSLRVKSVFTLYPLVDFTIREKDLHAPDDSVPSRMSAEAAGLLNDCYLYGGVNPKDPRVSSAFAAPASFPKDVFIYTAAQDPHCISGETLVQKIREAGKEVRWKRYEGCGSFFDKKPEPGADKQKAEAATREVYAAFAKYLKESGSA
jgi:acetyl esterase/lipase